MGLFDRPNADGHRMRGPAAFPARNEVRFVDVDCSQPFGVRGSLLHGPSGTYPRFGVPLTWPTSNFVRIGRLNRAQPLTAAVSQTRLSYGTGLRQFWNTGSTGLERHRCTSSTHPGATGVRRATTDGRIVQMLQSRPDIEWLLDDRGSPAAPSSSPHHRSTPAPILVWLGRLAARVGPGLLYIACRLPLPSFPPSVSRGQRDGASGDGVAAGGAHECRQAG